MSLQLQRGQLVLSNSAPEDDWLAARRQGIGASEIAAVAMLSARRGPWDVWSAKVEGTELEPTDVMRWGTFIEGRIIDWWARETGRQVGSGGLFRSADHKWLLATPDAVVLEYDGKPGAYRGLPQIVATVDAKTADGFSAPDWEDGAPLEYIAQATQQMLAVGVRRAFLVATIGGKPPVEREFELDEDLAAMLIECGEDLWRRVEDKIPPPVDGSASATAWLARRYPEADLSVARDLGDADMRTIGQLLEVQEGIAALQQVEEKLRNTIKDFLGEAWAGKRDGVPYVTWKTIHKIGYQVQPSRYRALHVTAAARKELRRGHRR